jgi:hypothetical protein
MSYITAGDKVKSKIMLDRFVKQAEDDIAYMNSLPNKMDGASAAQFDLSVINNIAGLAQQNNRNDVYDRLMPILQRLSMQVPRQQVQQ